MKFLTNKNKSVLTIEEKASLKKNRYLLILSGALLGLSFPPSPIPFLLFAGLVPYFFVIEKKDKLIDINRATYLMGLIFSILSLYWVSGIFVMKDNFLLIAGTLLLFVNPVFFLIPSSLFFITKKMFGNKIAFILFPFYWLSYEYLYMITDLKFPWLCLSNGLPKFSLFIQSADIIGAFGLSFLVVVINLLFFFNVKKYFYSKKFSVIGISFLLFVIIVPIVYGIIVTKNFVEKKEKIKVGLIQPNLDPYEKWANGNLESLTISYLKLSQQAVNNDAKIIIWPETALPVYLLAGNYSSSVDSIRNFVKKNNVFILTGMPDLNYFNSKEKSPDDAKFSAAGDFYYTTYNSILLFSPNDYSMQKYGKMKLVPFGEKVPFVETIPILGKWIKWGVGISSWNEGKDTTVFKFQISKNTIPDFLPNKNNLTEINVAGLVCYESIFPDYAAAFSQKGSNFIAVVTNDSWYGNSSGPYQHKEIGVLRAIENRKYLLRAANGGISCFINPLGETISESKMYEQNFLVGNISLEDQKTFYAENPLLIPVISVAVSIWIFGFYWIKKIKKMFKT